MNHLPNARIALAQTLESEAGWSAHKAQYCQDDRTARWAAAALACAEYLQSLPDDDDERVQRIAAACAWDRWQNGLQLGPDASLWASRCDLPPEQFLDALAMAAEADAERVKHDAMSPNNHADHGVAVASRRESASSLAIRVVRMACHNDGGWDGDPDPAELVNRWMGASTDPGHLDRQDDFVGAVLGVAVALASTLEQLVPGGAARVFDAARAEAEQVTAPR